MRVLLLTQWFDPEPTFKGLLFAKALRDAGHEVHVITGFPNYPGGIVYPDYRVRWRQHEMIDGIPVTRVALYPSHDGSAVGRVLNYLSFAASATLAGIFTRFKPDVAYVYHPPLTVGLAASVICFFRRIPFVYDIQDLWPDTLQATGMIGNRRLLNLVGWVARWVYGRATIIVTQSPGFVSRLIERGVTEGKIRLIYNWCDEPALAKRAKAGSVDLSLLEGRFNVVFAGNMGKAQALEAVLDAAALMEQQARAVQFVFVGAGTEVEALRAKARNFRNVVFLPRMGVAEVGNVLDAADVLLVHLRDSPLFEITLPSKIQAYLFMGKPVLVAVRGDAADLVERAQAGVRASPEDPGSIAAAVTRLAVLPMEQRRAMGASGRRYYDEHLSLEAGTRAMVRAFENAIAIRGSPVLRRSQ